jgi:hypothetical protein
MRGKKSHLKGQQGVFKEMFLALVFTHASQPQVSLATTHP